MTVTLTNTGRRMRTFLLHHDPFCVRAKSCRCTRTVGGTRFAGAVRVPAQGQAAGLSDAVLSLPDVVAAVRGGSIRAARVQEPASPARARASSASVSNAPTDEQVAPNEADASEPGRPSDGPDSPEPTGSQDKRRKRKGGVSK